MDLNKLENFDPKLDLLFERETKLTPEQLWTGWTDSEVLKKWFCPKPWKVTDCRIDLRPGGEFFTVMQGPEGERAENSGCYLEVIKYKKLVWTGMMTKGFRPVSVEKLDFAFVASIYFIPTSGGTVYRAVVAHADEKGRQQHEQMGFHEGWGMAFSQLEATQR